METFGQIESLLTQQQFTDISLFRVLYGLILCIILTSIVSWFYKRYSRSLGGKNHVGAVLPLIGLTVFLVITVVKSSLALSLGLVGALSIVRFRTPIKEPEELGYLFLSIAIGLGIAAGLEHVTILVTIIVLAYLRVSMIRTNRVAAGEYTLCIQCSISKHQMIEDCLKKEAVSAKLVRLHKSDNTLSGFYNVAIDSVKDINELIESMHEIDESVDVKFVESGVNW